MLFPALNMALQAASDPNEVGVATGTFVFSRSLGSAIGVSIGAAILSNVFQSRLTALQLPEDLGLEDATKAIDYIPVIRELDISADLKDSILNVYGDSVRYVWIAMASLGAIGFLSSFLIEELSIEKEEYGRQAFVD